MQAIKNTAELKMAIQQLEFKQAEEWPVLKDEFHKTYESLKLINIIKSTFKEAVSAPDLKTNVINTAIGLTTGVIAKKLIIGKTFNPLTKLLGIILEIAVANKATQNADGIKSIGSRIIKKLFNQHNGSVKV